MNNLNYALLFLKQMIIVITYLLCKKINKLIILINLIKRINYHANFHSEFENSNGFIYKKNEY
jgi:hypothetical protein